MKKTIVLFLVSVFGFSVFACSNNELFYKTWVNVTGEMSDDIFLAPNRGELDSIANTPGNSESIIVGEYKYTVVRDLLSLQDGTGDRFMELDRSYVELAYEERNFYIDEDDNIAVKVNFYDSEEEIHVRSYVLFKKNSDSCMWVGNVTPIFYNL